VARTRALGLHQDQQNRTEPRTTATTDQLLAALTAFAEFEPPLLRERQAEGIALAKARGAYKGRARTLSSAQAKILCTRAAAGEPKASLAREFGISRQTLYEYLRDQQ
jgi:DNA invertase Pin-like site-specific DNA recombinase